MKKIAILGSTGSIGTQTLEVVREQKDIEVVALACGSNVSLLEKQIREFHPRAVALWKEEDARAVSSFLRHWNALKENEFMRNLKQYACSITSLVACLSTAMLHILQHFESVIHQFMALVAMNVYNHSNATCIVFVLRVVKSLFLLSAHD